MCDANGWPGGKAECIQNCKWNAYSQKDGPVIGVSKRLYQSTTNTSEVGIVLGHELGHIVSGHAKTEFGKIIYEAERYPTVSNGKSTLIQPVYRGKRRSWFMENCQPTDENPSGGICTPNSNL